MKVQGRRTSDYQCEKGIVEVIVAVAVARAATLLQVSFGNMRKSTARAVLVRVNAALSDAEYQEDGRCTEGQNHEFKLRVPSYRCHVIRMMSSNIKARNLRC